MMATTEKTVKKLTIHKMKKKDYAQLPSKSADEMFLLTDVGGQVSEISEASADYVGEIVQYVGETNDTYTNGFFYKCVETDGVYSWTQVNVQEGGELPDNVLVNNGSEYALAVGKFASSTSFGVAIGGNSAVNSGPATYGGLALGYGAQTSKGSVVLNGSGNVVKGMKSGEFVVGTSSGTYTIISQYGTIPTDLYTTTPTTAGTYVPKLTIAEDGTATREWGTESGGAGGDYLPLSGGTLTGAIEFEWSGNYMASDTIMFKSKYHRLDTDTIVTHDVAKVGSVGDVTFFSTTYSYAFFPSMVGGVCNLGNANYYYGTTFTKKLNAGKQTNVNSGDLIVPTEGGTLARLEDLEGLGGASLPDQTDNAGKFLMTDGTSASWGGDDLLRNTAPEMYRTNTIRVGLTDFSSNSASAYVSITGRQGEFRSGSVAIGSVAKAGGSNSIAIGRYAHTTGDRSVIFDASGSSLNKNTEADVFAIGNGNGLFVMMDANGNVPRERLKNLVEVLPTEENGFVTVKNYGNGYVEISGCKEIGTVDPSGGDTVLIEFPEGYELLTPYWANVSCTSDSDMFSFKAEVKTRSVHDLVVAYKNEDDSTGLENACIFWEVRGMLFSTLE